MTMSNDRVRRILLDIGIVAPFIALICFVLWSEPRMPVHDQLFINYEIGPDRYPQFTGTLSSLLLLAFFKSFVSVPPDYLDAYVRSAFGAFFLISVFALGRAMKLRLRYLVLLLGLLTFSRFPMLWLSTEVATAAFLALFIAVALRCESKVPAGFVLALCALGKPNSIFLGMAMAAYLVVFEWRATRERLHFLIAFAGTLVLLNIPGIFVNGVANQFSLSQANIVFGQHYGALVYAHQGAPDAPNPWDESYDYYTKTIFAGANNLFEIVLKHPSKYSDFVVLSAWTGAKNFVRGYSMLVLPLSYALFWILSRGWRGLNLYERLSAVSLAGLLPLIMLAYPHIRHLTRYGALCMILILAFVCDERFQKRDRNIVFGGVLLTLAFYALRFARDIAQLDSIPTYWYPD